VVYSAEAILNRYRYHRGKKVVCQIDTPKRGRQMVKVSDLEPNPFQHSMIPDFPQYWQSRYLFQLENVPRLARAIAQEGSWRIVAVRPVEGKYQVINDLVYLAALQLAGVKEVEASIMPMTDEQMREALWLSEMETCPECNHVFPSEEGNNLAKKTKALRIS
jgi:hypothetical protein